ncbi:hypothetical protein P7C73_g5765, partial [Tremellales sp. Uapishka_1]
MLDLRKKLGALLPGEGAKSTLQNVLTIEWSGHKTVLVEVPSITGPKTDEVEMSGMGSNAGYGRLMDDYDDRQGDYSSPAKTKTLPPLPPADDYRAEPKSSYPSYPLSASGPGLPRRTFSSGSAADAGSPWSSFGKKDAQSPTTSVGTNSSRGTMQVQDPFR